MDNTLEIEWQAKKSSHTGSGRVIRRLMLMLVPVFMVLTSVAQTWFLSPAGAANAQTPGSWWSAEGGTGTQYNGNFQATGEFIIPANINGVVTASWTFGSAASGTNVTMTVNGSLAINNGVTLSLTRSGNGTGQITVTSGGSLIFLGTSATQITGNSTGNNSVTISAGSTLVTANSAGIRGTATSSFTLTTNQLLVTLDANANYVFNGADQTTNGLPATVNNLTLSGSGSKTLTSTQVNGTLLVTGNVTSSAGTSPTFGASGILRYNTSASHTTGTAFPATFGGAQVVVDMAAGTTLTLNANRTLTSANLVINSGTLDLSTFTINRATAGGTLNIANGATLSIGGTNSFPTNYNTHSIGATSTVNYSGTSQTVANLNAAAYGHLTLSGSGTKILQTGTNVIAGNFTLAGTASASAAVGLTIGGNITIGNTSAFSAGNYTHYVAGNWNKSGNNNFSANSSTIVFNGSNTTQTISGTNTFNNLTISPSGSGTVTASGSTLTVSGNLNVASGSFTGASTYGNVIIASGATMISESVGTINVTGNWTNNGNFTANSGMVVFSGTSTQSIGGSSSTIFYNLTMNGTGLKTLTVTAPATVSVANILTLTSGILDIASHTLSTGNTSGGSASSYVKTSSTGRLRQYVEYSATRSFPIGNSTFNPVAVTNHTQGGGDNFYFRVTDDAPTNANDNSKTLHRKWLLAKDFTGTVNVTLAFTFNSGDNRGTGFNGGTTPRLGFYNGTFWSYTTATVSGGTTYTASGEIQSLNDPEAFIAIGKDDAFSASKFGVTVFPQNPQLGAGGGIISGQSLNSTGVPTWVLEATTLTVSPVNSSDPRITTAFTASPTYQGTIPAGGYQADLNNITFTSATTDQTGPSQVKAARLSGESLADGYSATFNVVAGAIYEPTVSGKWNEVIWRVSSDGGLNWTSPATLPANDQFSVTELIRIPNGISLTANVTASFYSMIIETGGTLDLVASGTLTLLHPEGNINGYDIHVHGTFINSGGTFINNDGTGGTTYPIEIHGGTYWHARDGGSVPIAEWYSLGAVKSSCIIEGSNVGGLNQQFENFTLTSGANTLTGNMTVSGVLTLIAGKITTGNYRVITTVTGTIAANPGGWINGYLKRTAPVGTNISFLFPVGDETYYAPVTLFASAVTQSGTMEVATTRPGAAPPAASGLSSSRYINRKWNTANQGIVYSNATASWTFNDADEVGSPGTVSLRRLSGGTWYITGGTTNASESNTISVSGLAYLGETASSEMYLGESTCAVANVWFGTFDNNWHDVRNWCSGTIPTSSDNVLVPGGITRYPVISTSASVNNIEIMEGGSLTVTGSNILSVYGNLTNNGTFTANSSTVQFLGNTSNTVTGNLTFHNLTVNKTGAYGITAGSNITVNGTMHMASENPSATLGAFHTGSNTLYMGPNATNTGTGDVTGIMTRAHTFNLNTFYTFGHQYAGINFYFAESLPYSVSVKLAIGNAPTWTGTGFRDPLKFTYSIAQTGAINVRAYFQVFYLQSELPEGGIDESTLAIWTYSTATQTLTDRGWSAYDPNLNWLGVTLDIFANIPSALNIITVGVAPTSSEVNMWDGSESTDWNAAGNWSLNHVPTMSEGVIIPDAITTPNDPVLPSAGNPAVAKFLIVQRKGILNGGSGSLTIYNGLVSNAWMVEPEIPGSAAGVFNPGTSTIIFDSQVSYAQVGGTNDFYNLSVVQGSKVLLSDNAVTGILGQLMLANGAILDATTATNTVIFKGNSTQNIPNPYSPMLAGFNYLTLEGTGNKVLPSVLNVSCDLTNNVTVGTVDATTNSSTVILDCDKHNRIINIGGTTPILFHNLTVNSHHGVTASQDLTVNGNLYLQSHNPSDNKGVLHLPTHILSLGASSTITGMGDVTGRVKRNHVFSNNTFYPFTSVNHGFVPSNLPDQSTPLTIFMKMEIGSLPDWGSCTITTPPPAAFNPVKRVVTVWKDGNWSDAVANFRIRYLQSELPSNINQNLLSIWAKSVGTPCAVSDLGKSNQVVGSEGSDSYLGIASVPLSVIPTFEGDRQITLAVSSENYLVWNGSVSSDMEVASNWTPNAVPTAAYKLFIPVANSTDNDPVLPSNKLLYAKSIELQTGSLLLSGTNSVFELSGSGIVWTSGSNDNFDCGATCTVIINSGTQSSIVGQVMFNHLTISSGTTLFGTSNGVITIQGTFTSNGALNLQNNNNTVNFSGTDQSIPNTSSGVANYRNLIISGSGTVLPATLNLNGNFTYSGSGLVNTGSTLTMMGTTAQTIGGTSSATLHNLTISNAAGVTLGNSQTVNGTLNLASGLVNTGTHTLTVGASGSITGASASRYINGKLAHTYSTTGTKSFPIGKGGNYRPVTLNYTELTGTSIVTAEQFESSLPGTLPNSVTLYSTRHWSISQTGDSNYEYTLTLDGTGFSPRNASNAVIVKGDGSTAMPSAYTLHPAARSGELYSNTSALTSFSYFGLGESGTYWTGGSADWFTPSNWTSVHVPDGTGDINIPALPGETGFYPVISGTSQDNDVTITSGGSLDIAANATLTLEAGPVLTFASGSTVTTGTGAKIILESDATYLNLGTSTPTLEVQRTLTGPKGWRMVASPVTTTYSDMFDGLVTQGFTGSAYSTLQPNLLWWNEKDGGSTLQSWRIPANITHPDTAGRGYFFYVFNGATLPSPLTGSYSDALPKTMSATGVEHYNGSGNFSFSVTKTPRTVNPTETQTTDATAYAANEGWNLVGNPTASTLDWDASGEAWTKTSVDNTLYIWDPSANSNNGAYRVWNGETGDLGNGRIAPFQAFWVKANAATPVLSFNNSAKSSTGGTFLKSATTGTSVHVPITLSGLSMETTAYLSLSDNGIAGEDPMDAYRLQPMSDSWLAFYMNSTPSARLPLVINHLPLHIENDLYIPLYVDAQQAGKKVGGNLELQWDIPDGWPSDLSITLMDNTRKKAVNMRNQSVYRFSQVAVKSATAAAIDPLAMPAFLVEPSANTGNDAVLLKSAQLQPFIIVIGRGDNAEPVYVEPEAMLLPAYPNPFSQSTRICFRLPEEAPVQIDIYDINGRRLETAVHGIYPAGLHEVTWTPRTRFSGIYIIRLTSNNTVVTEKGIRMKER